MLVILFVSIYKLKKVQFLSQKQKYFSVEDRLLPGHKHGFLRPEENINLNEFQHFMAYGCWCIL